LSKKKIEIEQETERLRPSDISIIYADNRKLRSTTGWEPIFTFEQSLERVLNYWREKVTNQA
ncbi:MAG: GDP-mannose 4,6 dehydratase, partial [Anaerolineae bacterium]|nr:GDP-mannose 4,6 dehydratase [Anaerolineae bacterium]